MEKLPLVSNLAEHAEEERRVEREEVEREGGVRIRGKVDERLRGGGEMRPGEGKVE